MTIPLPVSVLNSQSPPQQQDPLSVPDVANKCPPQFEAVCMLQSYMHCNFSLSREDSSEFPRLVTEESVGVITTAPFKPKL